MAIIKCKMCGGDLNLIEGQSVAECEYCGSRQTVPAADNEKKLTLFARANRLRAACEFDKAAGVYETIVADFPEEAEAYWGLVLCKYGIEYVDDPATGRKIPTCHRSSFDSILEDGDFEQAMENADAIARKVYREEAKQIEEIRKGIIAVSANEQPYDIFICYKESDANGDRTLDSVLAQDLYDALTAKGYRTFFARITLEDKLGQEYEPYIFAALNSAKIMLAVGTDYEYFNAVWVKNEWSRFLKLMAKDKDKHLIPCYKGIDAYDMPKEFARLQAQDLGKMGAIQDILRGVEKLLPRKEPATVIQERVVVGGSGDNKIASLLDRGNMALEDGDWAKADSFFEDVLNNDSKNAQAYLGKTLAQEKCRTIDAFARKRKDASQTVRGETLKLEPNRAHIDEMVKKFSLPGYVEQSEIRDLYTYDLSYHSDVAERKQQYRNEENYWANHKQLSRAEKFAVGAVAENLQREKKALFAALSDRMKKAEAAEAVAKQNVKKRYEAHLKRADEDAEALYNGGLSRREDCYQELLQIAKTSSDVQKLTRTAERFKELGDYQDSKNLAEHCRKRASEEQAKIDAENERQRILKEKQKQAQKAKNKKYLRIVAVIALLAVAASLAWKFYFYPNSRYNQAVAMMEAGNYLEAISAFETLEGYSDSEEQIAACNIAILDEKYEAAVALMEAGDYREALAEFDALNGYKDSVEQARALRGQFAVRDTISAGVNHTVGLRSDGTVVAVGDNDHGQCDVEGWTDIIAISTGYDYTVGLRSDGTVVAVGDNDDGQCDVASWRDIIAVSVGSWHTVGLRSDGTGHTVGLKADGTVVAVGDNDDGQCDVASWRDIIAVSAGSGHTVGLKADGTVVAVGDNYDGQCDVASWRDIIAVSVGSWHMVGLKADGTVVAVGYKGSGQCDVEGWTDIKIPE